MQCVRIRKTLINYAIGDARVTERLCVEVHTSRCPSCQKELEDICELLAASERVLAHPYPTHDFDGLMARIRSGEIPMRDITVSGGWRWRTIGARAAALAAVIAVLVITAPAARNAGDVMRDLRDVSANSELVTGESLQVPIVSGPFVKRALEISRGPLSGASALGAVEQLFP